MAARRSNKEDKRTSDFASSLMTLWIYSAEKPQSVCAENDEKITEGADPKYRHYAIDGRLWWYTAPGIELSSLAD